MNRMTTSGAGELGWADVDACSLPTVERPLRLADFDDLFTAVTSIELFTATHARLLMAGDRACADRTQRLADAETACCSFFTFAVTTVDDELVALSRHCATTSAAGCSPNRTAAPAVTGSTRPRR